jgi:hypothetical protein
MIMSISIAFCLLNLIHVLFRWSMWLTIVPGFAPKRIYLEKEPERPKGASRGPTTSTQSKKGFLGVQWGFGDTKK